MEAQNALKTSDEHNSSDNIEIIAKLMNMKDSLMK
jgi:hypothetical protein